MESLLIVTAGSDAALNDVPALDVLAEEVVTSKPKLTSMQCEKIENALCELAAKGCVAADIALTRDALVKAMGALNLESA